MLQEGNTKWGWSATLAEQVWGAATVQCGLVSVYYSVHVDVCLYQLVCVRGFMSVHKPVDMSI